MLTGSHAVGETRADSDIDVVLLSELSNRQTTESLTFDGCVYQFIVFPCNKIHELVYKDYMTAHFVFLSLFEKGVILYDEGGRLEQLKRYVLSSKPWTLKDRDILALRASVTSSLDVLHNDKDPKSNLCTASEAVVMTARLICGRKSYSGKHLDKILPAYPKETEVLYHALGKYLNDGDGRAFSASLEALLCPFGGLLKNHTNGYALSTPTSSRHFLAFLPEALPSDERTMCNIRIIVKKTFNFMPTVFYVGQGQSMEQGIYISFHSPENNIPEALRILETTTEDLDFTSFGHGISYPYPSCFYEGLYLGGQLLYDDLANVMSTLSNLTMKHWGKETGSYRLLLAYRFAYYYLHDVVPKKEMRTFLADTLSRLMPEVLDTNGMYNTRQLLARKRKLLTCMDKKYNEQKEELLPLVGQKEVLYPELDNILKGICINLKKVLNKSKEESSDFQSFPTAGISLYYYLFIHSLGVLLLKPHEKFGITYNISRLLDNDSQ